MCIGDSIRMGYEPTVVRELAGWAEVVEMGSIQGGNTRNVLEHLDEWVVQRDLDIVHINAGLHDLARDVGPGPVNRVSVDEYQENLRRILSTLQQETRARIVFGLSTPVNLERQHAVDYPINRINDDVILYNERAAAVCKALGIVTNDLYQLVVDHGVGRMLGPDGVHMTEEAYEILGGAAAAAVRRVAGEGSS
jgi:lysophospholipase L1-like esterase